METRRGFMKTVPCAAIGLSTLPASSEDLDEDCRKAAQLLQRAMEAKHGGVWATSVSHTAHAAIVFQKSPRL